MTERVDMKLEQWGQEVLRRISRTALRDIRLHIILLVVEVLMGTQTLTCVVSNFLWSSGSAVV